MRKPAISDLHFRVEFPDGSYWRDFFKRVDRWSERRQEWVSTTKFLNTFMDGEDEMSAKEIKVAFEVWLKRVNPKGFEVSYFYL